MASAKETPRQKLIGIMYLILLALLALQVSSAIMEKFKYLDDSITLSNDRMQVQSDQLEASIKKSVADLGNKASDVALMQKGIEVRKEAALARTYIETLREHLIKETGGYEDSRDPNSMFVGAKDEGKVEDLMIGAKKAEELQLKVNGYCQKLRAITGDANYMDLALDPKKDPRVSARSEQKNKSFAEFNFAGTPMVAAMAVLSNLSGEVNRYELNALERIQNGVGGERLDMDKVVPMFRADAGTVMAGTKYKAELFLAATSSTIKPVMSANGRTLQVNSDGVGNLEFLASSDSYGPDGYAQKKWSGQVTFKNKGKDTTFTISGSYKVAKPYVDFQTSVSTVIYRNCSNELKLSCPPLGADFNPAYTGSAGGEIIKGTTPGKISVVPDKPEFVLKVANNGASIDQKKYRVLLVPRPTIKLNNGGREVNEKDGLKLPLPTSLKITVTADDNFKLVCPNDIKYNPTEAEVTVIRGRNAIYGPVIVKNGIIALDQIRKLNLLGNERIYIETKKIQRANFRGQVEDVNVVERWNLSIVP